MIENKNLKKYSQFHRKKNRSTAKTKIIPLKKLSIFNNKKIKNIDIINFTRQLSAMINAGLPIIQSLELITQSNENSTMNDLISTIKLDIQSGFKISTALSKHPKYFDQLYCALIEAGEESGSLTTMLERLAIYMEKIDLIKRKIKKALFYPIAVIIVGATVSGILLLKVIPEFKNLFQSVGVGLPVFTQFVLNLSDWFQHNLLNLLISAAVIFIIFHILKKRSLSFQFFFDDLKLKTPIIGTIYIKSILARFSRTLATTFSSGMPLIESLKIVSQSPDNLIYQTAIEKTQISITEGKSLYNALESTRRFPPVILQMVSIGEETGELDQMLNNVAKIYEEEVDNTIDSLSTLIEPVIMTILGILVGGLVIAMYLPIFQLGDVVSK